jgi:uncharacterized membrane protein YkoI
MKINKYVITLLAAAGILTGCNRSVESASNKFNELPPAVQKTVRAQAPQGEIADVSHKTENGMDVYRVTFREPGQNPEIVVSSDGKLLSTDMAKPAGAIQRALTPTGATGTKFSALPEKVQRTIQSTAPGAEIGDISRQESNGRVIYKIEFREPGKNPSIRVAEDGTLVQDLQR